MEFRLTSAGDESLSTPKDRKLRNWWRAKALKANKHDAGHEGDSSAYFLDMFKSDTPYACFGDDFTTSRDFHVLPFHHFNEACTQANQNQDSVIMAFMLGKEGQVHISIAMASA